MKRTSTAPMTAPISPDRLTDNGRDEGTGDTEQRCQDEARGIVGAGREKACDDAGNKADKNDPDKVHDVPRNDLDAVNFASVI
jgi:hypothetical protein